MKTLIQFQAVAKNTLYTYSKEYNLSAGGIAALVAGNPLKFDGLAGYLYVADLVVLTEVDLLGEESFFIDINEGLHEGEDYGIFLAVEPADAQQEEKMILDVLEEIFGSPEATPIFAQVEGVA